MKRIVDARKRSVEIAHLAGVHQQPEEDQPTQMRKYQHYDYQRDEARSSGIIILSCGLIIGLLAGTIGTLAVLTWLGEI